MPLSLLLGVDNETKNNLKYHITLETNKQPLKINELFDDLNKNFKDYDILKNKTTSVLFIYPNKKEVAINIDKTNGYYIIESDNYECILFITNQIVNRIKEKY